jgi:hypothetical protein
MKFIDVFFDCQDKGAHLMEKQFQSAEICIISTSPKKNAKTFFPTFFAPTKKRRSFGANHKFQLLTRHFHQAEEKPFFWEEAPSRSSQTVTARGRPAFPLRL